MESKSDNKQNTPSEDCQKSESIEPKQDSTKNGSSGEAHKITKKNSTEEKDNMHNYSDKEKSHQTKEHKEIIMHVKEVILNDEKDKVNKEHALKPINKPSSKGSHKGMTPYSVSKGDRKESNISSGSNKAQEGFYYNENHEVMPVFMKKLAQNKNQNLMNSNNQQVIKKQCLSCKEDVEVYTNQNNLINTQFSDENSDEYLDSQENVEAETSAAIQEVRDLLKNNKNWVKQTLEHNPEFLKEISSPQHPKYLIVSCSDSRILTSKILGTHPGELFVHRNIGNIVLAADFNMQSVLSYAVENLKVKNIIVLGHTDCGAIKTSLSNKYHGLIDHWLKPVKDLVEKHHDYLDRIMKKNPEKLTTKLSELNVKEQVINLCKNPIVQKAWNDGQELNIHGLLFDMETGFVKDLKTMKKEWKMIEDIHALEFTK